MKEMYDCEQDDQLRTLLVHELRELGIKLPKSGKCVATRVQQEKVDSGTVFGCPLDSLTTTTVDTGGLQVQVPRFLFTALSYLRNHFHVEGLFRKAGSVTRQRKLKENLDNGGSVCNAEAQDVACIVKQFLRQLPEPLIVRRLQNAFVGILESSSDAVIQCRALQIVCLLLPVAHLHALRYIMLFFSDLERHSLVNKMTVSNLAVVLTPNIFVSESEPSHKDKQICLLQKQMGAFELLMGNAELIGLVPDVLVDRVHLQASMNQAVSVEDSCAGRPLAAVSARKKSDKKRHSINGVFSELRRMVRPVRHTSESVIGSPAAGVSPSTSTPPSSSKRKHDDEAAPLSSSKKRALMQAACLDVPIPPQPHFDSPEPESRREPSSFTPNDGLGIETKRKSGRLRIFNKSYLQRRSSLGRTSKICKRSTSKESMMSATAAAAAVVGKNGADIAHPSSTDDVFSKISGVGGAISPAFYFTRAYHRERAAASVVPVAVSILQEKSINLSPTGGNEVFDLQPSKDFDCVVSLERLRRMPSSDSKVCGGARRTRSKSETDSNDENQNVDAPAAAAAPSTTTTPPPTTHEFRRPANGGSTLRRGRPNTVRSGLPVPTNGDGSAVKSSAKTQPMVGDSPCPLLVAIDQPIFVEPGVTPMPPQHPSPPNFDREKTDVGSAGRRSRRSVSLSDIFQDARRSLATPEPNLSNSCKQIFGFEDGNGEVFLPDAELSCSVESGINWKNAAVVLQDIRSLNNIETETQGRPSLIRLKKEKAGMVSMSVKLYNDAIARKMTEPVGGELTGDRPLRIASPVRIPPIFVEPRSSSQSRRKTTSSQKSRTRATQNILTPSTCCSSGGGGGGGSRSRRRLISQSSCHSPNLTTSSRKSSPRGGNPTTSQRKSAVRRSPRFVHHSDDSSLSSTNMTTIKAKAASDAYRKRAIRGQLKRRSTVV